MIANAAIPSRLSRLLRHALLGTVVAGTWSLGVGMALAEPVTEDAPTVYRLKGSTFQRGCFPPCLCPVLQRADVRGTFSLAFTEFDGLFYTYAVAEVNWTVALSNREWHITGSGTYKVGGEFAVEHRLELDLQVNDAPVQHFDSGLVAGGAEFPDITITVSIHGQHCFDTVLAVSASPVPADQVLTVAVTFADGCLGAPEPGEVCLAVLTPGTYSIVVRDEGNTRVAVERRCATEGLASCRERKVQGVVGVQ